MDSNLREMGISDLKVPKEMRRMGEAYYGRAQAYDAALAAPGDGGRGWSRRCPAIIYGGAPPDTGCAGGGLRPICRKRYGESADAGVGRSGGRDDRVSRSGCDSAGSQAKS